MESLQNYMDRHKSHKEKSCDFVEYLYTLLDKHNISKSSQVYIKANITKQAWSKIICKEVTPSLNTLIKIAFVLHLDNHECKYLLKKGGYTLSSSSTFALIVRYCIENKIYDLYTLNDYLIMYGQKEIT